MPCTYKGRHITPMGQVHANVGDLAGPSADRPEWVCVESGAPGRWVRVPAEPLDLDAITTRANRATGGDMDAAFVSADEDVPALVDEVRRLRALWVGRWQPAESFHEGDQVRLPDGSVRVIGSGGAPGAWPSSYRVTPHPETLQLDPPLTFEAGEMAVWATDGSRVGRYRRDDASDWRLIEQRELKP